MCVCVCVCVCVCIAVSCLGLFCLGFLLHFFDFCLVPSLRNLIGKCLLSLCLAILAEYMSIYVFEPKATSQVLCVSNLFAVLLFPVFLRLEHHHRLWRMVYLPFNSEGVAVWPVTTRTAVFWYTLRSAGSRCTWGSLWRWPSWRSQKSPRTPSATTVCFLPIGSSRSPTLSHHESNLEHPKQTLPITPPSRTTPHYNLWRTDEEM